MSEYKNTDTIPAEDVGDSKPWRLPFWTEPTGGANSSVPRVDELEQIRREAYNEGLEQGLVEGRQQGVAEGKKDGFEAGHKEGQEQGYQAGQESGKKAGYDDGRTQADQELAQQLEQLHAVVEQLNQSIQERDQQLPDVVAHLCQQLCEQVLHYELQDGAKAIKEFVDAALRLLPAGEKAQTIYLAADDMQHFERSDVGQKLQPLCQLDHTLKAGQCRVESEHSLVEYSTSDYFNQAVKQLGERIMSAPDSALQSEQETLTEVEPDVDASPESPAGDEPELSAIHESSPKPKPKTEAEDAAKPVSD